MTALLEWTDLFGRQLFELLIGSTLVLLTVLLATALFVRRSAAMRHRILAVSLVGLLILPLCGQLLPRLGPAWSSLIPQTPVRQPSQPSGLIAPDAQVPLDASSQPQGTHVSEPKTGGKPLIGLESSPPTNVIPTRSTRVTASIEPSARPSSAAPIQAETPGKRKAGRWLPSLSATSLLCLAWVSASLWQLLLLARDLAAARRMVHGAFNVDDRRLTNMLSELVQRTGCRRTVQLLCSSETQVPVTARWWNPVIILPTGFGKWSDERCRVVLAHELTHVVRSDVLWHFVTRWAKAAYSLHPLVYWVARKIRCEREFACDDAVVQLGERSSRYAIHLVEVAAAARSAAHPPVIAMAMAGPSLVEQRVRALLNDSLCRAPVSRGAGWGIVAMALLLVSGIAVSAPRPNEAEEAKVPPQQEKEPSSKTKKATAKKKSVLGSLLNLIPKRIKVARDATTTGKMRVRAVDFSGSPLANARVRIGVWAQPSFRGKRDYVTDKDGYATLVLPKKLGLLRVWVRKSGYVPLFTQWWPEHQPDGHLVPDKFTFRVPRGTVIGGVVKDANGEPIAGASVAVMYSGGAKRMWSGARPRVDTWLATEAQVVKTDETGRWTLNNVPKGNVRLSIRLSHPNYVGDQRWGEMQREQGVTTGSLRAQSARLTMSRGVRVFGRVVDSQGKPIRRAVVIRGTDPYLQSGSQEVYTDADGKYQFPPLRPGKLPITVVARGWAPQMKNVELSFGMGNVDFQLQQGRKLRIQFVTRTGAPVPKVYAGIRGWRGIKSLYNTRHPNVLTTHIPQRSDEQGIFEWDWAPHDAVQFEFTRRGIADKEMAVVATGKEQTVTLDTVLMVSGTAMDAKAGRPLKRFTVAPVLYFRSDELFVDRSKKANGRDGRFQIQFDRMDVAHGIRIEAAGYRTRTLGSWNIGDKDPVLRIRMEPAADIQGQIVDEDGKAVAGAHVYLATRTQRLDVHDHRRSQLNSSENLFTKSDSRGAFRLPPQSEWYGLVVVHPHGYANTSLRYDQQPGRLILKKWAKVTGRVFAQGKPVAGQMVRLLPIRADYAPYPRISESFAAHTDENGRFVFDRVPPIPSSIQAHLGVWKNSKLRSSESVPLDLQSGQHASIELNGQGVEVSGRVVLRGATRRKIDLNYSINYLLALRDGIKPPAGVGKLGLNWRKGWSDVLTTNLEGKAYRRTLHHYFVKLSRDGTFQISGVPAGKYELAFKLYEPPTKGCLVAPVGFQRIRFEIKKSQRFNLQLGDVAVTAENRVEMGEEAPDFSFEAMDGRKRSLRAFRGKYVVVDCWATWCAPCLAKLPAMARLHKRFSGRGVIVLGVNLDANKETVKKLVQKRKLGWPQGFLGDWSKSTMPRAYGLNSIPAYLVIDPRGKLVLRTYDDSAVREFLEKTVR